MNAGSSIKPQKAQVKDKGLGAESRDLGATLTAFPLNIQKKSWHLVCSGEFHPENTYLGRQHHYLE